jgi:hypothetical protein
MKSILLKISISALFVLGFVTVSLAQAPPPPPPGVPVDGGLGILAAAGIGYGAKKYRDYKKNKR